MPCALCRTHLQTARGTRKAVSGQASRRARSVVTGGGDQRAPSQPFLPHHTLSNFSLPLLHSKPVNDFGQNSSSVYRHVAARRSLQPLRFFCYHVSRLYPSSIFSPVSHSTAGEQVTPIETPVGPKTEWPLSLVARPWTYPLLVLLPWLPSLRLARTSVSHLFVSGDSRHTWFCRRSGSRSRRDAETPQATCIPLYPSTYRGSPTRHML